ncbi:transglycosylase domain-containing protein [Pontivivens ytuae]|uniref:peptidoglycan glycosyltransferase n=1 Tax=Pontivivens ytuae TaxID=2789856 RepID=A0A7S9QDY7_9RHOB|nr:PBP1A family penicillin-binding protein [Pontivivens ytuae]QPH55788.1 PBP1A family penicillin-binding protein [Pontivivens ytuae]
MSDKRKRTRRAPRRRFPARMARWLARATLWLGIRVGGVTVAVVGAATVFYLMQLPEADELLDGRERGSVTMLDRNGDVFAWRGEQGGVVSAADMSLHLRNAVVATEDKRFWNHYGISPRGIAGAIRINLREGRSALSGHGGSTITQQVAKLVFLQDESTWMRKLKEVPYAFAMELAYTKEEILSIYMNRAYLGASANGFEAAAQRYFAISAREVDIPQSAMLAGLLTAPSRFAPTRDLSRAQNRSRVILRLMHEQGYISDTEYVDARTSPAVLSAEAQRRSGGYFADWIMEDGPEFLTSETSEDIRIATTYDPALQRAAEQGLTGVFEELVREGSQAQAAVVVLSRDGAVRAMVGGRAIGGAGTFNRATQALRQPGSAFKPFVYAAGLEGGMNPTDYLVDRPITLNIPGSGPWTPQNYTRTHIGPVSMHEAFARSINTTAVQVSEETGRGRVIATARALGLDSALQDTPSLALGVSETTLLDLTGAYAAFLNRGLRAEPFGLLEVRLRDGGELLLNRETPEPVRAVSERTAGYMTWMMGQVTASPYGTGRRAALEDRPVAGKTGTTQAARDAWFIGFSGDYVTGVWMGYDDNTPLTGVTGGGLPAEIWKRVMRGVHQGQGVTPLPALVPIAPQTPPQVATANSGNNGRVVIRRERVEQRTEDAIRNVVEGVLRGLLGN